MGLRRVSFQIAFIGLGCRRRASVEKWWERSTGIAMDEEAIDIAGNGRKRQLDVCSIYKSKGGRKETESTQLRMLGKAVDDDGGRGGTYTNIYLLALRHVRIPHIRGWLVPGAVTRRNCKVRVMQRVRVTDGRGCAKARGPGQ